MEKARFAEPAMTLLLSVVIMLAVANSLLQTALQAGFTDPLSLVVFTIIGFSGFLAAFSLKRILSMLPSRRGFKLRFKRKQGGIPSIEGQPTSLKEEASPSPMETPPSSSAKPPERVEQVKEQKGPESKEQESSPPAVKEQAPSASQQVVKPVEPTSNNTPSEEAAAPLQVDLSAIKELSYRVDTLEREFEQFRSDLADLVEGIESTLIDLRAAVSEISNPFNILRRYKEILSLSPPEEHREETEVQEALSEQESEVKVEKSPPQVEEVKPDLQIEKAAEELRSILRVERKMETPRSPLAKIASDAFAAGLSLGKLIKLIHWTGETLSLGRSRFLDVVDLCEEMSMISSEIKALLLHVADYLESMSTESLSEAVVEVCLSLYKLGKILGFSDPEAEAAVRSIIARRGCSEV